MDDICNPVSTFVKAIANELNRDNHMHQRFKMHRYTKVVIPRLEKLAAIAHNNPMALAVTAFVAVRVWGLLLYPALLTVQAIMSLRLSTKRPLGDSKDIFFANSVISLISAKNASFQGDYLYTSINLERLGNSDTSIGTMRDYVTLSDVCAAFSNSIRGLFLITRTIKTPGATFQMYAAFNWFLTWAVLQKMTRHANSIWIACDSDRWAVLIDQLQTPAKKMIVQHGLLSDPSGAVGSRTIQPLPTRLEHIDSIVILNEESKSKYAELVLTENSQTRFMKMRWDVLQFSEHESNGNITDIILIGQHEYLQLESRLLNYLAESCHSSIKIYFKPHPSYGRKRYFKLLSSRIEMIGDLDHMPLVKYCLCFNYSTLAYLYEEKGVEVIYLNNSQEDILNYVENRIRNLII